jgi:biotin carboxyl carrier protein
VVSGERYKKIPDETIKYALQLYGPPVVPVDSNVMDRIMSLPRTKEFLNWEPGGYLKSIEELRQEIGPELSDDDLLLKILIPGKPLRKADTGKQAPVASVLPAAHAASLPSEFSVEVDGEIFNVKILPRQNEIEAIAATKKQEPEKLPEGAVVCDMAGLVLSLEVKTGDRVDRGDPLAVIEAMKMRRPVQAPRGGMVREILAKEGEIIDAGSILMVIV